MSTRQPGSAVGRAPAGLLFVAGLHLAVIWAFANGLNVRWVPDSAEKMLATFFPPKPLPPPKPIPVTVAPTNLVRQIEIAPPELLPVPDDPPPVIPQAEPPAGSRTSGEAVVVPMAPVIVGPSLDPRTPLTQPDYPAASIRLNEQGVLEIEVLVGIDGDVKNARIARSSGFRRLDDAALAESVRRWKLRPATRDGIPFEQWHRLRVVFELQSR